MSEQTVFTVMVRHVDYLGHKCSVPDCYIWLCTGVEIVQPQ